MKHSYLTKALIVFTLLFSGLASKAQQSEDILNLLIQKNVISQQEADSIRSEQAVKEQQKRDHDKKNQHGVYIGSKALQLSGLVQTEYQGFQQKGAINTFSLHRARLDVKGDISNQWSYEVYTEFAGGTPKLLDAYTSYKIADYLKFTAGQFKVPFSIESLFSDSQLEFIDRSQVDNALVARSTKDPIGNQNGRDIGIQVGGNVFKLDDHYLFDYTVAVLNGAGYNVTTDNNNRKDVAARLTVHPVKDLSISGDVYYGLATYGTPAANQKRNRQGIDARYVIGGLALQAEYDKGIDGKTKKDGWYGQATYFVLPKQLQLAAKYDTYDPNKVIGTDRTNIYTGGVNYFFNDWAKFTVDYLYQREEVKQVPNNIIEAQLQLTF